MKCPEPAFQKAWSIRREPQIEPSEKFYPNLTTLGGGKSKG
jgi:hypothetical protein